MIYLKKFFQFIAFVSFIVLVLSYGEDYMTGEYFGLFYISTTIKIACAVIFFIYLMSETMYYFGNRK